MVPPLLLHLRVESRYLGLHATFSHFNVYVYFSDVGEFIEVILNQWKDDYELLERNHSYIQWLFPLQEQGMNFRARMLTKKEIEMMKKDKEVQRRFIEAYKLMLGFYGINLVTEATGEVKRAEKFEERFDNLDYHSHNNLRITRILKCLGELGFEHYQAPLVKFFLVETLVEKQLPGVKNSVLDYFMFTVKDKQQRRDLVHFAWENYEPGSKFIWGPIEKLKKYKKPSDCDSDVGGETGGKENMAKTQEAEKRCGEHGDRKHQVGGDDDDSKISSHVGVAHDLESQKIKLNEEQSGNNEPNGKNVVESQGEQKTLDWNVEEKEHSKEEEGKESIRSTDNYDDTTSPPPPPNPASSE
uniref:Opioid growth factor receptor (OGFr) conserved domain-containing protein n=1 Tax=Leptobrachium leishanense TaxID=445787 RepID=A0A8C5R3V9_9ANUR